ncbi:MAG: HAD family phosphatase, partial [Bacteroidales bacterium]|nr:HAD family phosphatase [Bacteroidales bacterium]
LGAMSSIHSPLQELLKTKRRKMENLIKVDTILFFDMDGTLIDTDYSNFLSYKKAIHSVTNNGIHLSFDPKNRFNRSLLKIALPNLTKVDYEKIIQKKEEYYEGFLTETKLNEEIADVLNKFSKTNKTFLVTNCRKDRVLMTLNHFGLTEKFDGIFYRKITDKKEKVNKFQNAISELGISPNLVIAFEYEKIEIEYAKKAGIKIINPMIY